MHNLYKQLEQHSHTTNIITNIKVAKLNKSKKQYFVFVWKFYFTQVVPIVKMSNTNTRVIYHICLQYIDGNATHDIHVWRICTQVILCYKELLCDCMTLDGVTLPIYTTHCMIEGTILEHVCVFWCLLSLMNLVTLLFLPAHDITCLRNISFVKHSSNSPI